jgi:hypothetical protein
MPLYKSETEALRVAFEALFKYLWHGVSRSEGLKSLVTF